MDDWGRLLRTIQHAGYNRWYRQKNAWGNKFSTISNTWRKYYYQKEGSREKKVEFRKECKTMDERLINCFKCWNDNRRRDPWAKAFENMRSNWRDRGKRIYGKTRKR